MILSEKLSALDVDKAATFTHNHPALSLIRVRLKLPRTVKNRTASQNNQFDALIIIVDSRTAPIPGKAK